MTSRLLAALLLCLTCSRAALAQDAPEDTAGEQELPAINELLEGESMTEPLQPECITIGDDQERLECYDELARRNQVSVTGTPLDTRIIQEQETIDNSFSLIAHQPSYFLPFAYAKEPNEAPFAALPNAEDLELDNLEVKFQISFRVPLNRQFFFRNSHLWFGYTQLSLWQLYNKSDSAPFRETNYEPELIWEFLVNKPFGDLKLTHLALALNHQSNGRSEPLSRSWNRIYINSIWAYEKWIISFRPWYRLPESSADDDNPDIEDYMGNFDIRVGRRYDDHTFTAMFRSNLDLDNMHSFYELGYSYSINRKFRGYIQFVSGYGESLIDYNYRTSRLSFGIMLNDWL
jgi:phospholipase A1